VHISPLVLPVIVLLLFLTMMLKLVPRNTIFGVRTQETLSSDEKWYHANRRAGAGGVIGSVVWLAVAAVAPRYGIAAGYVTIVGIACVIIGSIAAGKT
jgi:uncharacterized membrane protein